MKRLHHIYYYIVPLLAYILFTACAHVDAEFGVDFGKLPTNGKKFIPYYERDIQSETSYASPVMRIASSIGSTDVARGLVESLSAGTVHQVCGTYWSIAPEGDSVRLSGAIYYPKSGPIKNIIVAAHYTITADFEAPSQTFCMEGYLANKGYAIVMPDYLGYGVTRDSVHPYMRATITSIHILDMALAVRPFFAERGITIKSDEIYLLGYSQGAAAIANSLFQLDTEIDEASGNYMYKDKIKVKRVFCGGGPYYISEMFTRSINENTMGIPCAVPMLVMGMNCNVGADFDYSYFFQPNILEHYEEWINSKVYTVNQLNELIGTNCMSEILLPDALDLTKPQTKRMLYYLKIEDMPLGYIPKVPLYLFHSTVDRTVPFYNSENFYHAIGSPAWVVTDFHDYGPHAMGFVTFLMKVYRMLP